MVSDWQVVGTIETLGYRYSRTAALSNWPVPQDFLKPRCDGGEGSSRYCGAYDKVRVDPQTHRSFMVRCAVFDCLNGHGDLQKSVEVALRWVGQGKMPPLTSPI